MRKISTYLLMTVAVAIIFPGCSSNCLDDSGVSREFRFNVAVTPFTKAVRNSESVEYAPLGIWSFKDDGATYLDDEKMCCMDDGVWQLENGKMWQKDVDKLDFIAYSPYGRGCYDGEKGISYEAYDVDEGLDLMYSNPLIGHDREQSQAIVNINMQKSLACVRLKAKAVVPEYTDIIVKKVVFSGICAVGDFRSLPEPYWYNQSDERDFCFFEGEQEIDGEDVPLGDRLCMIPQYKSCTINVLCDIVTGEVVLRDQVLNCPFMVFWEPGKLTTHIIKINGKLEVSIEKGN